MNEGFAWWLLIAGIGVGVALAWLVMGRLARSDDDVGEPEREAEAAWISRSISAYGGVAPPALVEEILDLHRHYLEGPGLDPENGPPLRGDAAAWDDSPDAPPSYRAETPRSPTRTGLGSFSSSATTNRSPGSPASEGSSIGPAQ
jgi:hypothetical protein